MAEDSSPQASSSDIDRYGQARRREVDALRFEEHEIVVNFARELRARYGAAIEQVPMYHKLIGSTMPGTPEGLSHPDIEADIINFVRGRIATLGLT